MKKNYGLMAMLSVAGYISAQMLSDILSIKVASVAGLAIDGGTFIYPITFTLRDMVHKTWGKKIARSIIVTAGVINVIMALLLQFVVSLPPDQFWGFQNEFALILGPVWRIVIASILAEIVSELIDTEAYSAFVSKFGNKYQWGRVLFSNAFSVPIDSVIFALVAFVGTMPLFVVGSIILSNILVKGAMTVVSIPGIYLAPDNREA